VKRSRTGRIQALNFNGGGSLRFSAGLGETSGEAQCRKSQSADDPTGIQLQSRILAVKNVIRAAFETL
jgi:hypothetical protein